MTASTKATATETHEPAKCLRCRRTLRNASPDGYGPKCRTKIRKAAKRVELAEYKEALAEKAVALIEAGGLVPLRKNRVFLVSSSDGTATYKTARQACNCPAGLKGKYVCYHRIAAHILHLAA